MNAPELERMQIGELAREAGMSHRAIHHYEKLGLLKALNREPLGHRYYDRTALDRLWLIDRLKQIGLSLEEIASVIDLYDEDAAGVKGKAGVIAILEKHVSDAEIKIRDLQRLKEHAQLHIDRLRELIAKGKQPAKH